MFGLSQFSETSNSHRVSITLVFFLLSRTYAPISVGAPGPSLNFPRGDRALSRIEAKNAISFLKVCETIAEAEYNG